VAEEFEELVAGGRLDGKEGEVGGDVFWVAHADEGGGETGSAANELEGALGVILETEDVGDVGRELARELGLQKRGAGDEVDAERARGLHHRESFTLHELIGVGEGLGHGEIERQLDEAEVVRIAGDFTSDRDHFVEGQISAGRIVFAESVPGGDAVGGDFLLRYGGFEESERATDAAAKFLARDFAELRFGIVEIKDVDAGEAEIAAAAFELIGEIFRGHAVAARGDLFGTHDAGLDVFAGEVFVDVLGHVRIWSEKAGFCADDEFFARETTLSERAQG